MQHKIRKDGDVVVLGLEGQLTSKDRSEFVEMIPSLLGEGKGSVRVDLKNLVYMDSVGLGMMITLRDEAEKKGMVTAIANPTGDVKELLEMACFDRLFEIT